MIGAAQRELVWLDTDFSVVNRATYTFSGMDLGAPDAKRTILVGVSSQAVTTGGRPTDVTVAGVSATQRVSQGPNPYLEFWTASVPAGTSGDVVVTHAGTIVSCRVAIWGMYRFDSPVVNDWDGDWNQRPGVVAINVPNRGAVVGFTTAISGATIPTTWTGLDRDFDEGGGLFFSGANAQNLPADASYDVTVQTNTLQVSYIVASWS